MNRRRFMMNGLEENCLLKHQTDIWEVLETDMIRLASYTDDPLILRELSKSCFESVRRQAAQNQHSAQNEAISIMLANSPGILAAS